MQPNSASTAYVSATDALFFIDARWVGDLVNDIGVRSTNLDANATWQAALDAAAGEIESAALAGGRYEPADLVALVTVTPPATTPLVSGRRLQALNAGLAAGLLLSRRQPIGERPDMVRYAEEMLEQLRKGERIFGFIETQKAGQPDRIDDLDPNTRPQLSGRDRRYFGIRDKYRSTVWGGGGEGW
jgi:hypothetical protein